MKCYNCEKSEELIRKGKNLFSNIERIETDLKDYSDEEEKFMPLCQECMEKWENGKLGDIEKKWINEEDKQNYISLD